MTEVIEREVTITGDYAFIEPDGTSIVRYSYTEAALAALRQRADAALAADLTTVKGNDLARGFRKDLVALRTALEKRRKELKGPAIEFGAKIDAEAKRITGEILRLEEPIDRVIKADEERREAERKARAEAEAKRVAELRAGVEKIRGYVFHAVGLPAARIQAGIDMLVRAEFGGEWQEFLAEAQQAKAETIAKLTEMHAAALRAEAAAAEAKRQAEELAAARAREAELAAQLHQHQEAERKRREDELAAQRAESDRLERLAAERRRALAPVDPNTGEILTHERPDVANRLQGDAVQPVQDDRAVLDAEAGAGAAADAQGDDAGVQGGDQGELSGPQQASVPDVAPEPATLKLGEIARRLGFNLPEAFLSDVLQIARAGKEKNSVLYRESQWPAIKTALVLHIGGLE